MYASKRNRISAQSKDAEEANRFPRQQTLKLNRVHQ